MELKEKPKKDRRLIYKGTNVNQYNITSNESMIHDFLNLE
jgi:hypothetical protein